MKIKLQNQNLIEFDLRKYCEDRNIELENIEGLYLDNNSLTSFELPKECKNIRWLNLDNNPIKEHKNLRKKLKQNEA